VSAPTRVDLAGGTLDLWPLYCLTDGAYTINVAIDLAATARFDVSPHPTCRVEIRARGENFLFFEPLNFSDLERVPASLRFPVAIVSRYLHQKEKLPNLSIEISLETLAPVGSGLGGSSTLCVAVTKGLSRIFSDFTDMNWRWQMLDWVRDLEAAFLQTPTGVQDYLAALFGGVNCFEFQTGARSQHSYSKEVLDGIGARLIVLFSGEQHHSGLSNWEVFKGALQKDQRTLSGLRSIRDIAFEMNDELTRSEISWPKIGELMSREWKTRRDLFGVNTPRLDSIVDSLSRMGILGVKVCGAAAGGSLIALVDPSEIPRISAACTKEKIEVLKTSPSPSGVSIIPA
jgi:D-glycero-alpha-D-manno-heptose-7-phosphate kinase